MAAVESQMLELGTPAPTFSLPDPEGNLHSLPDSADAYVIMFICNHCPFVKHVADQLAAIGRDYADSNVAIIAINSNDVDRHPDDAPDKMKAEAGARGYTFPYVFDKEQSVAKAYRAACTPDFFVFNAAKQLTYRGQLDDSRPSNDEPVDGHDLRNAINRTIEGVQATDEQVPSIGCNIKWKPGNEPDYFAT